ncbi:hypothetical protein BDP27DRAFT_1412424 [Rhodocollybia butyracea]|uniref:F-box domain-containing protein n=1 Tax=Rhodocollybia butyracea TaxID=206335 RepID=A0A9P5UFL7_9AGAR|nr:hypothetical protein BDP27DRAFT_1412424 [Rhodocollybia butyracea]
MANAKPHTHLSVELISLIAIALPVKDLLSFSLVCHDFQNLALGILYKDISSHHVNDQCLSTLACNKRAARAVKSLILPIQLISAIEHYTWLGELPEDPSLQNVAPGEKAVLLLPSLPNLQELSIPPLSAKYAQLLSQCTLPNLRVLSYDMPLKQPVLSFISRTTTLVSLSFNSFLPLHPDVSTQTTALPQLRHLSGSPQIVKLFAKHAPLNRVHIDWRYKRPKTDELDEALSVLAKYCSKTLEELAVHRSLFRSSTSNTNILIKVSERLPDITRLGLNGVQLEPKSTICKALSRFKYLEYLDMDQYPPSAVRPPRLYGSSESLAPTYKQDEVLMLSWASDTSCPMLRECRLPNGVTWSLRGPKLWVPTAPSKKYLPLKFFWSANTFLPNPITF